jgi:hypothetical protein
MPGSHDANLRSGLFKEAYGILLLQGVAAVAKVPIHSDVGIDALVTLLRREGTRRLLAEESCYVQLKSDLYNSVDYSGDELLWLLSLELPFFIGIVSLDGISLYATHCLSHIHGSGLKIVAVRLNLGISEPSMTHGVYSIGTGPPVLQWELSDIEDKARVEKIYEVIKSHVVIAKRNIVHRLASRYEHVSWDTNDPAESVGYGITAQPFDDAAYTKLLAAIFPFIESWMFSLQSRRQYEDLGAISRVLLKLEKYGFLGINQISELHHMIRLAEDPPYRNKVIPPAVEPQS